ncbi:MAG: hypothetical protein A3H97_15165 [Acidobacteria bacterium RIFCSPLOWO2_02_FULL_65_29]|nr:MAG: hypothetical protein A3H97_15165 [Acidobacteria bacterium RIFCSPLOWO2_02_FULL_65_29]
MRSRAARLTATAAALMALGAAGYLFFTIEQDIAFRRETLRSFDRRAREVASALADMRAAEQAYVAAGQGTDFWMPKVAALLADVAPRVDALRPSAATNEARSALMEAAALVTEFGNIDRRARDYLRSGQTLMAGDVVFSEGGETTAAAVRQVESARLAENRGFDLAEARLGRRQAAVMGGAAGFSVLVLLALAVAAPKPREEARGGDEAPAEAAGELMLREPAARPTPAGGPIPLLKAAAELCTDFGRLTDSRDLTRLLSRVATVMDASGVVVWLGDHPGADLRPVFAHGYSDQALARMTATAIPRAADNAVAAAYRSETLQVVLSRPGASNGAVVAPLLTPEGCIGAFTAELLAGRETSEAVQAIASLFAAQLTGVLAASVQRAESPATQRVVSR